MSIFVFKISKQTTFEIPRLVQYVGTTEAVDCMKLNKVRLKMDW